MGMCGLTAARMCGRCMAAISRSPPPILRFYRGLGKRLGKDGTGGTR